VSRREKVCVCSLVSKVCVRGIRTVYIFTKRVLGGQARSYVRRLMLSQVRKCVN
jgi:hypothetical protein